MSSINVLAEGEFGAPRAPRQGLLWDTPSIDPINRLKAAMREALRNCPLSRTKVVTDMNELASIEGMTCNGNAQKISEALLDKWVAAGANAFIIPLRYLPLFCKVTGNTASLQAVCAPLGLQIIGDEDRKILEWARAELRRRHLTKEAKRLAQEVGLK